MTATITRDVTATAPGDARRTRAAKRRLSVPHLLLIPAILILLVGMGYPLVWQIVTSLQEFGIQQQFGKPADFVGLAELHRPRHRPHHVAGRRAARCSSASSPPPSPSSSASCSPCS